MHLNTPVRKAAFMALIVVVGLVMLLLVGAVVMQ